MKSTQKEIRARVDAIVQLKTMGALLSDIRQHFQQQGKHFSDRQLARYCAQAEVEMSKALERNRDRLLAYHFTARRALYARCIAVSDHATAARVLRDEAELLALYPPKQVGLVGSDGGPVVLHVVEEIIDPQRPPFPVMEVPVNGHHVPAITDGRADEDRPSQDANGLPGQ